MQKPTVLLLSTSDTDLITARASGADYRWANPSRLVSGELAEHLAGADLVVVRILGGYRAWQDGIDAVVASGGADRRGQRRAVTRRRADGPLHRPRGHRGRRRTSTWRRAARTTCASCTPSSPTRCC